MQVDVRNRCEVRVRGVVIFEQKSGDPIRQPIVLDSGDWTTAYACHGNGKVGKDFAPDRGRPARPFEGHDPRPTLVSFRR